MADGEGRARCWRCRDTPGPLGKAGYLLTAGYDLLLFDLRGHGRSDGNYTTLGEAEPDGRGGSRR
jgi:pimeloyl-ACP methyl ester carboxylesterase